MPRCSGLPAPLFRPRCVLAGRFSKRELSCYSPCLAESRGPQDGAQPSIDAEHSALIDTDSLRNTLDSIRAANRTRLIRKVDQEGRFERLSLPQLLDVPVTGLSKDAATVQVFGNLDKAKASAAKEKIQAGSNAALNLFGRKRRPLMAKRISGLVSAVSPQWEVGEHGAQHQTPWLPLVPPSDVRTSLEWLAVEIGAFNEYFTYTPQEKTQAEQAIADLKKLMSMMQVEEPLRLEVIGSQSSGLASPGSDIDLNLVKEGKERHDAVSDRMGSVRQLHKLSRAIMRKKRLNGREFLDGRTFSYPLLIARARVPILWFTHLPTGLDIQVQHNNQAYDTTEYAKAFLREYPDLAPIFRVVRQAIAIRALNATPFGGMSSYVLLNLIVASFRSQEAKGGPDDIASRLLYFLDFVTNIDFQTTGIIVNPFELVDRGTGTELAYDQPHWKIYMPDPADAGNILGRATHRIRDVQATLIVLRSKLVAAMGMWEEEQQRLSSTASLRLRPPYSVLNSLLEANYRGIQLNRAALRFDRGLRREDS